MKTIILLLIIITALSSICNSQITQDYPFKTYLDNDNNLYLVGYKQIGNTNDIYVAKYSINVNPPALTWDENYPNSFGDDRGLDLAVDQQGNTFVTGYIFNNLTNSNDIITLKYNSGGILQWDSVYSKAGDDKGMGIDITIDGFGYANEIFISGYVTSPSSGKDFIIKKYSRNGITLWQDIFDKYTGDDAATDIILDADYAYMIGYTFQGEKYLNDIIIISYSKDSASSREPLIYKVPYTNEKPTEFILLPYDSPPSVQKSRSAVISVTDGMLNITTGSTGSSYLTTYFDPDVNNKLKIRWSKTFNSGFFATNIGTSICLDTAGDIYVSGYTAIEKSNPQLDFATLKYKSADGRDVWPDAKYHDFEESQLNDKASSIKINDSNHIYVAGQSDGAQNGFSFAKYEQAPDNKPPKKIFHRGFAPNFVQNDYPVTLDNKYAKIELTNDGTPLIIMMGWNENTAYWSAVKYDANGEIEYTINNETQDSDNAPSNRNAKNKNEIVIDNYPNPFNPSTKINYELPVEQIGNSIYDVKLTVYNILGAEIATLVNKAQPAGSYTVTFDAANFSSGIYFYKLSLNGMEVQTKRMLLLK